jgi:hypothetical protein
MARKPTARSEKKGRPIDLKPWWLDEAKRRVKGISTTDIVTKVSAGRVKPWDETKVRNFLRGRWCTEEMALAFCREFKLPSPVYYPRTFEEADRMRVVAADYDQIPSRVADVDQVTAIIESESDRQIGAVESADETRSKRGRSRRVGRGGPSSS